MKITRRQLRQIVLEACGCGSSPEKPDDLGQWIDPDSLGDFSDLGQTNVDHDEAFSAGCSVCGAPSGKCGHDHERVDVDFESPDYGHVRGDVDEMDPEEAFIAGFIMGQSGDFDGMIEPPAVVDAFHPRDVESREDAWSGGDNLDDPVDHARIETGESNAGPHARLQHRSVREGKSKISHSALLDIIREELGVINEVDDGDEDPIEPGESGYDAQQRRGHQEAREALADFAMAQQKWNTGGKSGTYEIDFSSDMLHLIFKIDGVDETNSSRFGDPYEKRTKPDLYKKKMSVLKDMKYKDPSEAVKKNWKFFEEWTGKLGKFTTTVAKTETPDGQYDNVEWVKKNQTRIFSDILDGKGYLKRGSKDSNRVTALQTLLVAAGEKPGKIDGDYGGGTYNAVRSFQSKLRKIEKQTRQGRKGAAKNVRISIDGVAGRQTIVSLLSAGPDGPANTLVAITGQDSGENIGGERELKDLSSSERNAAIALTKKLKQEDNINVTARRVHTWLALGKTEDQIRTLARKA